VDTVSKKQRSFNMSRIRSRDTAPEIFVRSLLHRLGFRFRKNVKALPGKPDIVLPKHRIAIFVHGCFWHQHPKCKRSTVPRTNMEYWIPKLRGNVDRDKQHKKKLEEIGWKTCIVWECEIKNPDRLKLRLLKLFVG